MHLRTEYLGRLGRHEKRLAVTVVEEAMSTDGASAALGVAEGELG